MKDNENRKGSEKPSEYDDYTELFFKFEEWNQLLNEIWDKYKKHGQDLGIDIVNISDIGKCEWYVNYCKKLIKPPYEEHISFYTNLIKKIIISIDLLQFLKSKKLEYLDNA